jgi:hypothetical protein
MARVRSLSIVLVLAITALFASIMPPPVAVKAQTVGAAPREVAPFPKPPTLMRGVDTHCPYFFRSTISGPDRVGIRYYVDDAKSKTDEASALFTDIVVVAGTNAIPTVKPLDGSWDSAKRWELKMLSTTRDENQGCLPPITMQAPAR